MKILIVDTNVIREMYYNTHQFNVFTDVWLQLIDAIKTLNAKCKIVILDEVFKEVEDIELQEKLKQIKDNFVQVHSYADKLANVKNIYNKHQKDISTLKADFHIIACGIKFLENITNRNDEVIIVTREKNNYSDIIKEINKDANYKTSNLRIPVAIQLLELSNLKFYDEGNWGNFFADFMNNQ